MIIENKYMLIGLKDGQYEFLIYNVEDLKNPYFIGVFGNN